MLNLTSKDFFMCYSPDMKEYFKSKGMRYILSGLDRRSHQPFWAYLRCDALMDIVHHWDEIKETLASSDDSK